MNGKIFFWELLFLSLLLVLVVLEKSYAHSDPAGDVYPIVKVERKNFVVYFSNNNERKLEYTKDGVLKPYLNYYKTIISPDSKIIQKRKKIDAIPEDKPDCELTPDDSGYLIKDKDQWLIFPRVKPVFKNKPFMIRLEDGSRKKIEFPWGETKIEDIDGVIKFKDEVIFLVSLEPKEKDYEKGYPFYFYKFKEDGKGEPISVKVGKPNRKIWGFAACSNIVEQYPRCIVSWLERSEGDGDCRLMLSVWDVPESALQTKVIKKSVSWNTSISMARIENKILIAWHEWGKIKTRLVDLKSMEQASKHGN